MEIRFVTEDDAEQILDIYSEYVTHSTVTFETEVPSKEDFEKRISEIRQKYPYICVCENNTILAYAYASSYSFRQAYDWSCSLSIYVQKDRRHGGIGRVMYSCLLNILRDMGFCTYLACITSPNPASQNFHAALGFEKIAYFKNVGYKFDEWRAVSWYELTRDDIPDVPSPTCNPEDYKKSEKCAKVLEKYNTILKSSAV